MTDFFTDDDLEAVEQMAANEIWDDLHNRLKFLVPKPLDILRIYDLWVEGYHEWGGPNGAQYAGSIFASSFNDACSTFFSDKENQWGKFRPETNSVWGCRIFDNEADARKSFG